MINTLLDLIEFLNSNFTLLLALAVYTPLTVIFAKSIKKSSTAYYWAFGVVSFIFVIPVMCRLLGIELPFNLRNIPIIGMAGAELSSAANFIHPILIIIMYMGAFSPKIPFVGRLMSIRKELSIIVGFPLMAHLAKRLFFTFPKSWGFFANYEESIADPRVVSVAGATIENFVMVLGFVMTVLFFVLWVTSFDSVRRKLGKRWKSVQRWSYLLYALLFIHSAGLQVGALMEYNAKQEIAKTEIATSDNATVESKPVATAGHGSKSTSLARIKIDRGCRAKVNILIYILIYGSYLYFRLRKAKEDRLRR